jgi:hypothetical protein
MKPNEIFDSIAKGEIKFNTEFIKKTDLEEYLADTFEGVDGYYLLKSKFKKRFNLKD